MTGSVKVCEASLRADDDCLNTALDTSTVTADLIMPLRSIPVPNQDRSSWTPMTTNAELALPSCSPKLFGRYTSAPPP